MNLKRFLLAIPLLFVVLVCHADESPPFEVKDPALTENLRQIYQNFDGIPISSAGAYISKTNPGIYCDQMAGGGNGFECFSSGQLVLFFPGNGDFELYPSTANSSAFLQYAFNAGQPMLQSRPTTFKSDLGSTTFPFKSLYLSTGIVATTTNDSAPAGYYGEYGSTASVVTLNVVTNNVFVNYVSTTLAAGDWDVAGELDMIANGTGATALYAAISVNSANTTTDQVAGINQVRGFPNTANIGFALTVPPYRISINTPTTVYLKFAAGFVSGTPQAVQGGMRMRRIR